jgi:hypothetical protein
MKKLLLLLIVFSNINCHKKQAGSIIVRPDPPKPIIKEYRYAGIEIGSKGVKFVILDVREQEDKFTFTPIQQEDKNVDVVTFDPKKMQDAAEAVKNYYEIAKSPPYSIPDGKIYICVSYGVVMAATEKELANDADHNTLLTNLKRRVLALIPNFSSTRNGCIGFLKKSQEPELTHLGIIQKNHRKDYSLVDIGSGNMKGGFFVDKDFQPFELELGTVTLYKLATENTHSSTPADYRASYIRSVENILKNKNDAIREAVKDLRTNNTVVLSGGICWAIAKTTAPDDNAALQRLTIENVDRFITIVSDNKNFLEEKKRNKGLENISKKFSDVQLIAGAMLLKKTMEWIQQDSDEYLFMACTEGMVAWLKGLIVFNIAENAFYDVCR